MDTLHELTEEEALRIQGGAFWAGVAASAIGYWVTENWSDIKQGAADGFRDAFNLKRLPR